MDSHYMKMEFAESAGAQNWQRLRESRWHHTPEQRHLIVLYYSQKASKIAIRGITDGNVVAAKPVVQKIDLAALMADAKRRGEGQGTKNKLEEEFYKRRQAEFEKRSNSKAEEYKPERAPKVGPAKNASGEDDG